MRHLKSSSACSIESYEAITAIAAVRAIGLDAHRCGIVLCSSGGRWLCRRSQGGLTWAGMSRLLQRRYPLPTPAITRPV
jgi:hypothetical protein